MALFYNGAVINFVINFVMVSGVEPRTTGTSVPIVRYMSLCAKCYK